jgi:hypothetical protein
MFPILINFLFDLGPVIIAGRAVCLLASDNAILNLESIVHCQVCRGVRSLVIAVEIAFTALQRFIPRS